MWGGFVTKVENVFFVKKWKMGVCFVKIGKWGCFFVKKAENVFFCKKKWTFPRRRVHYVQ